jgi:hypothetical protein
VSDVALLGGAATRPAHRGVPGRTADARRRAGCSSATCGPRASPRRRGTPRPPASPTTSAEPATACELSR